VHGNAYRRSLADTLTLVHCHTAIHTLRRYSIIPGGGYTSTTNFSGIINTMEMQSNVIMVFVRYRVNVFGFMALEGLSLETSPIMSSGNAGLMDQIQALKWVQQNIASFGGDPTRVTIDGGSAGSWSMCAHLVMPMSKGLFSQVVAHSGACDTINVVTRTLEAAEAVGQQIATAANCSVTALGGNYSAQVACLRSASVQQLNAAWLAGSGVQWYYHNALGQVVCRKLHFASLEFAPPARGRWIAAQVR
jgi:carboxylesterase type B